MREAESNSNSDYLKRPDAQGHLKVLEVLREWDPIGVFAIDKDWPDDEYNSYAPTLIRMLDRGVSCDRIVDWMRDVAIDYMGNSTFDEAHSRACADKLIAFWREWKQ